MTGPSADNSAPNPRALWENGQWQALRALNLHDLATQDHRHQLALFVASAHFHASDAFGARTMLRQAIDWGATRSEILDVLFGGIQNTLGRMALLMDRSDQAKAYFRASVAAVQRGEAADKTAFVRQFHEMLALGLLPAAAESLSETVRGTLDTAPDGSDWATMINTKIDHLNHVLSLSLSKGQLNPSGPDMTEPQNAQAYAARHSTAQLGQDIWVLEQSGFKREGYFVEFGATNGILLSNTYLLETAFDWSGLCAEPNPIFFAQLQRNRNCITAPDCIAGETGQTVTFIAADEYGGIADYAASDSHADKRAAYAQSGHTLELTTLSLHDFLTKHGAPQQIDYLSIDTEGSEYDILAAFPFDQWDIRLITVEHNFTPMRDKIAALLQAQSYSRTEAKWDDWYVKSDPS